MIKDKKDRVKELADFAKLSPAKQKKIMKKVITMAANMQCATIEKANACR